MSLSRDDVLRELELLPVWKLRAPQNVPLVVEPTVPDQNLLMPEVALSPLAVSALPEVVEAPAPEWLAVTSDDDRFLFILAPDLSADAETLLQNMLQAMAVQPKTRIVAQITTILNEWSPKLLIAMGENVAQNLLAVTTPLEQLRGNVYQAQNLPLIVTYSPVHLLNHTADKAKAWQDLCLALAHMPQLD